MAFYRTIFFCGVAKATKAANLGQYDLCIIGGGPAGIAAALRAVDYNKKVCLIEKKKIGGTDLWDGTLPSKTMWHHSDLLEKLDGEPAKRLYGEKIAPFVSLNESVLKEKILSVSRTREEQILSAIQKTSINLLYGKATFINNYEIQVRDSENRDYKTLSANYYIIATGSSPNEHPFVKTDGKLVMNSNHIMHFDELPKTLVVVGGGVLGCEFASIFAGLRKTKVFLVDKASCVLPREDPDVVERVEQSLEQAGVTIHHNSVLYDVRPCYCKEDCAGNKTGVEYTIMHKKTREFSTLQVDRALIAVGRQPNYDGLGIENTTAGKHNGVLEVNENGQCKNAPHIFVAGAADGGHNYVPMSEAKGKFCVDVIFSTPANLPSPDSIARIAFLTTAVASVGKNEKTCQEKGISYLAAKVSYETVSRAVASGNTTGFLKIIVSNDAKHTILGIQALGLHASALVDLGSLAIRRQQTAFDLADRLTAYPSVSEAFQECLRTILGSSQLKPGVHPGNQLTCWVPDACSAYGLQHPKSFTIGGEKDA